jgi:hypothetical protein
MQKKGQTNNYLNYGCQMALEGKNIQKGFYLANGNTMSMNLSR